MATFSKSKKLLQSVQVPLKKMTGPQVTSKGNLNRIYGGGGTGINGYGRNAVVSKSM